MNIPTFKIRFETSQTTDLATEMVIFNIRSKLREEGYEILTLPDKSLSFKFPPFKFVWSHQAPYILSGGVFEVRATTEGTIVTLDYFINMLSQLLIFTFLVTAIIIDGEYWAILFFGTFFFVASIFQYFTTKNVGKKLLNSILAEG
jgi:hypothetical protein